MRNQYFFGEKFCSETKKRFGMGKVDNGHQPFLTPSQLILEEDVGPGRMEPIYFRMRSPDRIVFLNSTSYTEI